MNEFIERIAPFLMDQRVHYLHVGRDGASHARALLQADATLDDIVLLQRGDQGHQDGLDGFGTVFEENAQPSEHYSGLQERRFIRKDAPRDASGAPSQGSAGVVSILYLETESSDSDATSLLRQLLEQARPDIIHLKADASGTDPDSGLRPMEELLAKEGFGVFGFFGQDQDNDEDLPFLTRVDVGFLKRDLLSHRPFAVSKSLLETRRRLAAEETRNAEILEELRYLKAQKGIKKRPVESASVRFVSALEDLRQPLTSREINDISKSFTLSDAQGAEIAVLFAYDERDEAQLQALIKRSGKSADYIGVPRAALGDPVQLAADIARHVDAEYVVLTNEKVLPNIDWLRSAHNTLETRNAAFLPFVDGNETGITDGSFIARKDWLSAKQPDLQADPSARSGTLGQKLALLAHQEQRLERNGSAVLADLRFLEIAKARPEAPSHSTTQIIRMPELGTTTLHERTEIAIVMPSIDMARALDAVHMLQKRAGLGADYYVALDEERHGFIETANAVFRKVNAKYVIYLAEDAFPGVNWLAEAHNRMEKSGKGLLAFNCGKWRGRIAAFGMVRKSWAERIYGNTLFHPGYLAHKADNELTIVARLRDEFVYEPKSLLMENDPLKVLVPKPSDLHLFETRFRDGFGGLVSPQDVEPLAEEYSVKMDA